MSVLTLPPLKQVASPNYSSRNGHAVSLVVVHDCEGSYPGSISWFANRASMVSAHIVLREDGLEATQMVAFANKAWHAVAFNPVSVGIEMAGFAAKGFDSPEWQSAANIVAYLLHKFGLPCRWAEHGEGQGFCSHYDLGAAGGDHHDPTTDAGVWQAFEGRVSSAYGLTMPAGWGAEPYTPAGTLRHDLVPPALDWAQARLNALGFGPLNVDGLYGPKTERAISIFQHARNLTASGELDTATVTALAA